MFVLFDNFSECYDFVEYLQGECGAYVESVDKWIDSQYPDLMLTYVELAQKIEEYIAQKSPSDCVIAPFSELARFYDNSTHKTFDALIKTIKAIQTTPEAARQSQRVYIPIVGLEGKMEAFYDDNQTIVWRLVSENKDLNYRLILTDDEDFSVKGLESRYTIVNDIRQWLNIWKDSKQQAKQEIICRSKAIFANAKYAQPDNAFNYVVCKSVYELLVEGLRLSFGGIEQQVSDGDNWDRMAERIDLNENFSFPRFVRSQLSIDDINDYKDFIGLWFSHPTIFERWLLARYYASKNDGEEYICTLLQETTNYGGSELIEKMACMLPRDEKESKVRNYCLQYAAKQHTILSEAAESRLSKRLLQLPSEVGYPVAMQHFTGISQKEKEIAITWIGQGHIGIAEIESFYPDLYEYLNEGVGVSSGIEDWGEEYFLSYKEAKIANRYSQSVGEKIKVHNGNEASFDAWYNQFKTTYTLLKDRKDIEVIY